MILNNNHRLQFITDGNDGQSTMIQALAALAGGCRFIQVRMKHAEKHEISQVLCALKPIAEFFNAFIVVDDHVDLAHLCHGVHLGRNDMAANEARKILGNNKLIGVTVNDINDINRIAGMPFDSIGLGPWRFTSTKEKLAATLGAEGTKTLIDNLRTIGITQPIYAIGGITVNDIADIANSGAFGIAISSSIGRNDNPIVATSEFIDNINKTLAFADNAY